MMWERLNFQIRMLYRFMRIILFFDLPSVSRKEKREYQKFVKYIKEEGFSMFQESVYTKLCLNETVVESTMKNIKSNIPKDGFISCLSLTEKQFSSIECLLGDFKSDVIISDERIIKL